MPTTVNYTSLFNDITVYLERGGSQTTDETVFNQIPRLINAAERELGNALKLLGQIEILVDPTGLQTGNHIVSKPDRWRKSISLVYGTGATKSNKTPLFERSKEYCETYWPDQSLTSSDNPPLFYSDVDYQHWVISPTPDQDYPLEVTAYFQPPLLDTGNETNFWTNYCPLALLYGSLLQATPFLKDDARLPVWGNMWAQEIQILNSQDLQRVMDRASERKAP